MKCPKGSRRRPQLDVGGSSTPAVRLLLRLVEAADYIIDGGPPCLNLVTHPERGIG
jgi:hypothetical protein